tara:strand:+ start:487 stop:2667 length:2181 start_codon:yes stop_codon:yes gene_type:complete
MLPFEETRKKHITGTDQRVYPDPNTANEIRMFSMDANGGWLNQNGWEPLIPTSATETIPTADFLGLYQPVRFLSIWSRHQNAEQYYLYERNGELRYDYGNKGTATTHTVSLGASRHIPKADDPGTQLAPYGRFALILNGNDEPIKFWGRELTEQFSWRGLPARPYALTPQPSAADTTVTNYIDAENSCIAVNKNSYYGVGSSSSGSVNTYSYRVAFLSKTGSMSPMSEEAVVQWRIASANQEYKFFVPLKDIPIGPKGTVARILFRTKNKGNGLSAQLDQHYELFRIDDNVTTVWIDNVPDSELGATAVDLQDSVVIDHSFKYASAWDNCMWLAGGTTHPTRIIYSKAGLPEQFAAFNYIDVGIRAGGHITQLVPYYNSLLVFRESAIDIITKTASGYQSSTLDPLIGTTASNTIRFVPEIGICFLTKDGVYAISGGIYGGSEHRAKNISGQLSDEWKRLTSGALARATATFSDKEQEYWVHYPADGETENIRGAALHTQTKGWSLRNSEDYERGNMKFTHLATDPAGWIIMGTYPTYNATPANAQSWPGIGLQVWSAASRWGNLYTYSSTADSNYIFNLTPYAKGNSVFRSVWEDEGSIDKKKSVSYVIIDGLSQGNNTVPLVWSVDGGYAESSSTAIATQQPEYFNTTQSQTIMGTAPTGAPRPLGIWNSSRWEESKRIALRYDIGATQVSTFRFEIRTANYFSFILYRMGYETLGLKTSSTRG